MIRVCIFKGLKSKLPMETPLSTIASMMKNSNKLRCLCECYKSLLKSAPEEAKRIKKTKIPAFAPGSFMFDGKSRNNVYGLTDMCLLDIDNLDPKKIDDIKSMLSIDRYVVLAAKSISGKGLHIIVRYELMNISHPFIANMKQSKMNKTYGVIFRTISQLYSHKYNFIVDPSGSNMERLCLMSFDKALYYNESAEKLQLHYSKNSIVVI